ncbi:toxin [Streptomyces sp. NPDC004528]|uniref:toxin n=1 Tax=Streptomyces sp. NPDC004528 TaxID=3154550 RepID=UPI0033A069ED
MRRFADLLIDPITVDLPADPEVLFNALVESAIQWRGRQINVYRACFPPDTATGLWLDRETHDDIIIEERAATWHQIVILGHELWHMSRGDAVLPQHLDAGDASQSVAARSDFSERVELEADQFGMLVGQRLRTLLTASADSVYAAENQGADTIAGRIGLALNYRGRTRR